MCEVNSKYNVISNIDAQYIIERYIGVQSFLIKGLYIRNLGDNAAGFISDHAILTINIEVDGFVQVHSFFLKISSQLLTVHGRYIEEIGAFKKEAGLFNGLLPLLQKYSGKKWSPRCLLTRKDIIVFENLSSAGFRNSEKKDRSILDLPHCEEGLKALARYHAASIIMEAKEAKGILAEFGNILRENTYVSDPSNPRKEWLDVGLRATLALMHLIPEFNQETKLKIENKLPEIFLELPKVVKPSSKYRNVVGHGDIWANNMMFRYENGRPVECLLVDFQFARYAPAAFDVMCLLHLASTRKFRKDYTGDLIDVYYKTVQEELLVHQLDVHTLMPYADFVKATKEFSRPALVEAIIFGHTILLPEALAVQILESPDGYAGFVLGDRESILREAWSIDPVFRELMQDRLVELVEEYIL